MSKLSTLFTDTKGFFDDLFNSSLNPAEKTWYFRNLLIAISKYSEEFGIDKFWKFIIAHFDELLEAGIFEYTADEAIKIKETLANPKALNALTLHVYSQADGQVINSKIWNCSKEELESVSSPIGYYWHADKGMVKIGKSNEKDPRGLYKMDLFNFAYDMQNVKYFPFKLSTKDLDAFSQGKWSEAKFNKFEAKIGQFLTDRFDLDYDYEEFNTEYEELCGSCFAENNGMIGGFSLANARDEYYGDNNPLEYLNRD